ncbi:hypothetical protein HGH92_05795 [Chitinophaga varians]|uniref:Uncharacterized protein n=1 Tax=Chitinophaga varians TaxID=2202339 RepID=A0A847R9P6_9BACT|nr:hypothetical protein [Chitinophaga varians]NLR63809.1 hypothetical protein [Chitinophaga varians]
MPVIDAEKYKDVPGYQQIYTGKAIRQLLNYGSQLHIRPTADKSLYTFMVRPDGSPFLIYKPSAYLALIPIATFVVLVSVSWLEPKPIYAGLSFATLFLASWGIARFAGMSSRKRPIVIVDQQGITMDKAFYSWNNIINTFIVERSRSYQRRQADFYLIIALTNRQTAFCRINRPAATRDEVSELATTITYFRNNY